MVVFFAIGSFVWGGDDGSCDDGGGSSARGRGEMVIASVSVGHELFGWLWSLN